MPELTLYYRADCGYCRKVLRFINDQQISLTLKNVAEGQAIRQELIAVAGSTQVPCLVINGRPMHESDDIIRWLRENKVNHDHP